MSAQQAGWLKRLTSVTRRFWKDHRDTITEVGLAFALTAIPFVNRAMLNAIRAAWLKTKGAESASGLRQFDAEGIIADTIRATSVLQDIMKIDAEFIAETLEEAFSEAAMVGLGGAMYLEAALAAGMAPYQQPHQPVEGEFDAQADVFTGIYWVNALHYRIEQYANEIKAAAARYDDLVALVELAAAPLSVLLRAGGIASAAAQVYQHVADAVNALLVRVTEMYSAYLAVKTAVEKGVEATEALETQRARLLATLQAVYENLRALEDALDAIGDVMDYAVDADAADAIMDAVDAILGRMVDRSMLDMAAWLRRLFNERVIRPDAGVEAVYYTADGRVRLRAYPTGYERVVESA